MTKATNIRTSAMNIDPTMITHSPYPYMNPNSAQRQESMFRDAAFRISIHKARNGHVVRIARNEGDLCDMWIVPDGEDVTKTISAAISTLALSGAVR